MSKEIELEKTYLAKFLPVDLDKSKKNKMVDVYLPKNSDHAKLRIRQSGDNFVITKKMVVNSSTSSIQTEENISLTRKEFLVLSEIDGNRILKNRYYYQFGDYVAEIDVFLGEHYGLVLVDFEFKTVEELNNFIMPSFCLADVTEEDIIAGGVLSHKSMKDVMENLKKFNYNKIFYDEN